MLQKVKSFFSSIKQQAISKKQSKQSNQKTPVCKICFKNIETNSFHYLFTRNPEICHNCLVELQPVFNEFIFEGVKCLNIYFYNEKIQSLLYQFKGCKDYELRNVFFEYYNNYINQRFENYIMIPAPSFIDSDKERGFNHVQEMFKNTKLEMICCVHKTKKVKQADLTSIERTKISDALVIDDIDLSSKKILLVDDVFTTGSTIKAMINLVKQQGAKAVKVLVMAKTIDLSERGV